MLDTDTLNPVALANLSRDVTSSTAAQVRAFIADPSGSASLPDSSDAKPRSRLTKDLIDRMNAGNKFNAENAYRYEYNEITVEYAGNPSGQARVDSLNPKNGNPEIISRKYTQLGEVQTNTAIGYLNELATKYPEGAVIADTPKNREKGINGDRLLGPQILEVPVRVLRKS